MGVSSKGSKPSANERLAKNTIIYLIGNAGSKLLQMLFLPVITSFLSTAEYGYYDLIVTSISLITPVVTFQITEAMFRNLFYGTENEKETVLSSVAAFITGGVTCLAIVMAALVWFRLPIQFPVLVFLNYFSNICFTYLQKVVRSEQHNSVVATAGVINTATMLAVQAFTLVVLGMRADGMLVANFVSYFVASLYMEKTAKLQKRISLRKIDLRGLWSMFKLSLPLVPNSVCWYFVSAGNSYLITTLVSAAANGVYAIANGFSQMLTFVTGVFQMAWQESSIIESSSEKRDVFYSATFNSYMKLLLSAYIVLLPFIKLAMPVLVSTSFQDGYIYVPVLLASAVFSAFSQFYGSAYLTFKKTGGALFTTLVAAAINCGICIIFIDKIGLFAPALGSATAFAVQWLIRIWQMSDYFKVKIDAAALLPLLLCAAASCLCFYLCGTAAQIVVFVLGLVVVLFFNRNLVKKVLSRVGKA